MSNVLSQSLNGSLTSPQSNHSNSEMENCNSLLNGQGGLNELTQTNVNRLKKELAEAAAAQQQLEQQPQHNNQQQSSDQPMEEDEMYGEEEENYEDEDQQEMLKNHLAGELERQLVGQLNANSSNASALNNLNSLLTNGNGSALLNNLAAQWNPALAALSSNGNFNNLANLTQALSNAGAFNGGTAAAAAAAAASISQPPANNQNSPQNSSSGSQHNLNASSLSNNGNLSYQNGSNGSNSQITHVEAAKGYTFEEQFKQLYELSPEKERKEFLDDLFSFMQKQGSPVNRIPIMAKQVLDIYELYKLVVARGGLVEVINKKIWREITKGLNLPSSITSAAFTLRTQYMKYLYPYECAKEKLSTKEELQQAIDGNRREGRRSSYGQYGDLMPDSPPQCNTPLAPNNNALNQLNQLNAFSNTQLAALAAQNPNALNLQVQLALAAMQQNPAFTNSNGSSSAQPNRLGRRGTTGSQGATTSSEEEDNASQSSLGRVSAHRAPLNGQIRPELALNLSNIIGQGASVNGNVNNTVTNNAHNGNARLLSNDYGSTRSSSSSDHLNGGKENNVNTMDLSRKLSDDEMATPSKRFLSEDEKYSSFGSVNNSTNIKIATSKDRNGGNDKSMQVSMEINGIIYSGTLFAQHSGLRA